MGSYVCILECWYMWDFEDKHLDWSLSPGSPGINDMITTRKRPRLAPFVLDRTDNFKTVAAVGEIGHIETPVISKAQSELGKAQANLVAVVQDPLPEALKIAEEAAKTSNLDRQVRENASSVDGTHSKNDMVQGLQGAVQGLQEKPSKKSIMDRNTTAHTVKVMLTFDCFWSSKLA